jgi:hypothetical protein
MALEYPKWEKSSPWFNSKYVHKASGAEWLIVLPDQAWQGEVRLLRLPGGNRLGQ